MELKDFTEKALNGCYNMEHAYLRNPKVISIFYRPATNSEPRNELFCVCVILKGFCKVFTKSNSIIRSYVL